jgi:LAO/AO transport system kinase
VLTPGWSERLTAGDRLTLTRVLTLVENRQLPLGAWANDIAPHLGHAFIIGITGWAGVGKSTLTGRLISELRGNDLKVGVLAVDPSSDRSGGAVLGDRVRMLAHAEDPGVFIRSLASRGSRGGLAGSTLEAADVLDAAGFDVILIETVGAGQTQTEILDLADTVVLVTAPGLGDDVQAIKGGILEIPDIIVVNQADRPSAARTKATLHWLTDSAGRVRILTTIATEGKGVPELWKHLQDHRSGQTEQDTHQRQTRRHKRRVWSLVEQIWDDALKQALRENGELQQKLDARTPGEPYDTAIALIQAACKACPQEQGRRKKR